MYSKAELAHSIDPYTTNLHLCTPLYPSRAPKQNETEQKMI
jgi:hypothetical protein